MDTPAQELAARVRAMLWGAGVSADRALARGAVTAEGFPEVLVTVRAVEDFTWVRGVLERADWGVMSAGETELVTWLPPGEDPVVDAPSQVG